MDLSESTARPRASWVMGRSARWHDTDLQAEIAAHELFGSPQGLLRTVVGVGLGGGIPLRVGWLLVRALRS